LNPVEGFKAHFSPNPPSFTPSSHKVPLRISHYAVHQCDDNTPIYGQTHGLDSLGVCCAAVSRKVVQQNCTRQCRKVLWVMRFVGGRKSKIHNLCLSLSLFLNTMNLNQATPTLSPHNTTRHCRVRFYAFVGLPLSK